MSSRFSRCILSAVVGVLMLPRTSLLAEGGEGANDASGIAFHYVGRVKLDFVHNTGVVYGYVTAMSGINTIGALFNGTPSEATAYLTFRADIQFQALPGNGALGPGQFGVSPTLVQAGSWSIYFTPNPAHDWNDPDTFSKQGAAVAVLDRPVEQFSVYPTFSISAGAAVVRSSSPFVIGGQTVNLHALVPRGLMDVTSGSPIPLAGSTATSPIFAVAGYSLAR